MSPNIREDFGKLVSLNIKIRQTKSENLQVLFLLLNWKNECLFFALEIS